MLKSFQAFLGNDRHRGGASIVADYQLSSSSNCPHHRNCVSDNSTAYSLTGETADSSPESSAVAMPSADGDPRIGSVKPRITYNTIGGVNGPLVILDNVSLSLVEERSIKAHIIL